MERRKILHKSETFDVVISRVIPRKSWTQKEACRRTRRFFRAERIDRDVQEKKKEFL